MHPPLSDGYHALPPGKLATVVTYLEMTAPSARPPVPTPAETSLVVVESWTVEAFKRLYVEIGSEWLWSSRLLMSESELLDRLHRAGSVSYAPVRDGRRIGVLEMDYARQSDVEISFFGVRPEVVGTGVAQWLMDQALRLAWSRPETRRVWLHTCHFDSPRALPFYMKMGFRPYARAVEVFDDARLIGRLDPAAGPHVPMIANARLPEG